MPLSFSVHGLAGQAFSRGTYITVLISVIDEGVLRIGIYQIINAAATGQCHGYTFSITGSQLLTIRITRISQEALGFLVVNVAELAFIKTAFFTSNPEADLNGDGVVNAGDLAILKSLFFQAPGPSGTVQ